MPKARPLAVWLLTAAVACGQGGGGCGLSCTDVVPYPDPPPLGGAVQADVLRARVTQGALDFLADNLGILLGSVLTIENGYARYYLPADALDPTGPIALRPGGFIAFSVDGLERGMSLSWLPDDAQGRPGLRFSIEDAAIYMDFVFALADSVSYFPPAACRLKERGQLASINIAALSFDLRIAVDTTGPAPRLTGATENIVIDLGGTNEESVLAMEVVPCDGTGDPEDLCVDPTCSLAGADCPGVCGVVDLFTQLGGFLVRVLEPVLDSLATPLADVVSGALLSALSSFPLGLETELDTRAMLGPVFRHLQALSVKVAASPNADVAGSLAGRGLDLGLDGGIAAPAAACASAATPPDYAGLIGPPPDYSGFIEVADASGTHFQPYHLALSLSEAFMAQATWGLFQSGLFCFNLDGYDVEQLSGGAFTLNAGLLVNFDARLSGLAEIESPMLLSIAATEQLRVRIGASEEVSPGVFDPLIELTANDLDLGVFMLLDDSQERIGGLTADLAIGIDVERSGSGAEVVITHLRVDDLRQYYGEIAPAADLGGLFAFVVDLALDTFVGDNLRFPFDIGGTLSDALGVTIEARIADVRRDLGPTGAPYLSLYAAFCGPTELADPANTLCYSPAVPPPPARGEEGAPRVWLDPASLYGPVDPVRHPPERWIGSPTGHARLEVRASEPTEYQTRVDGGPWTQLRTAHDGSLDVISPKLYVAGPHTIEVRAQRTGWAQTRSLLEPLRLWVDAERPLLTAAYDGESVEVQVQDLSGAELVQLFARWHEAGSVSDWQPAARRIDVSGQSGRLELVGRDAAGNLSSPVIVELDPAHGAEPASESRAAGCAATSSVMMAAAALLALGRRRR